MSLFATTLMNDVCAVVIPCPPKEMQATLEARRNYCKLLHEGWDQTTVVVDLEEAKGQGADGCVRQSDCPITQMAYMVDCKGLEYIHRGDIAVTVGDTPKKVYKSSSTAKLRTPPLEVESTHQRLSWHSFSAQLPQGLRLLPRPWQGGAMLGGNLQTWPEHVARV